MRLLKSLTKLGKYKKGTKPHTMTLNFYQYSKRVYAVFYNGEQRKVYVGTPLKWNKSKQRSGDPSFDAKLFEIETKFHHWLSKTSDPSLDEVHKLVKSEKMKATTTTLVELFELFMRDKRNVLQAPTLFKYKSVLAQIIKFKGDIPLRSVNKDFYLDFVEYLVEEENNVNKTILRKLKSIRTVMRYGVEEEIVEHSKWDRRVELKDVRASRYPLNEEERGRLWDYKTTDLLERRVLDAFIFSMYSGLRFEDLAKLSHHHIFTDTHDGQSIRYINMTATKGVTEETIPILSIVEPIIERYKGDPIFSIDWNSQCNEVIKRIAKKAGLTRMLEKVSVQGAKVKTSKKSLCDIISFHFARYTYTEMMSRAGLQVNYIQHNLNHSKLETTNAYMRSDSYDRVLETRAKMVGR